MGAASKRTSGRLRAWTIAASVAAHLAVFVGFVTQLARTPQVAEPPVINVQLARPARPHAQPQPARERLDLPNRRATAATTVGPEAPTPSSGPPDVVPPAAAVAGSVQGDERVGLALRRALGCRNAELLQLSARERERCRDTFAGAAPPVSAKLDLDRRGFGAAKDVEPYLQRRPKNGCKARAGGEASPSGEQGAAAGVGCAWAF